MTLFAILSFMKQIIYSLLVFGITVGFSGCTQVVTAPIKIAGSAVSTTFDVAGSAVHAVTGSDDDEEKHE